MLSALRARCSPIYTSAPLSCSVGAPATSTATAATTVGGVGATVCSGPLAVPILRGYGSKATISPAEFKPPPPVANDFSKPFLVGFAGGTASGKTSVCNQITKNLNVLHHNSEDISVVSTDWFYWSLTEEILKDVDNYDFDSPDAIDHENLYECLVNLKNGEKVEAPDYDFVTHTRTKSTHSVEPHTVIMVEGIMLFHYPKIREILDLKVFVDAERESRLARRIVRDVQERGRDIQSILTQYERTVKPAYDKFVEPTRQHADIILQNEVWPTAGINVLTNALAHRLWEAKKFREGTLDGDSSD